jgi:uncharacterized membrane protein
MAITTICYPFLVYWGLSSECDTSVLAIGGAILVLLQFGLRSLEAKKNIRLFLPLALALLATYIAAYFLKNSLYMRFTPVLVNLNFLVLFASSLFKQPSMVERFARIRFKDLPPEAIPYCRKITIIWVLFFIGNGSVAFWTAFQDLKIWTFYNGFLAYILMGAIFAGEFLYRTFMLKKKTNHIQQI